MTVMVVGNRYRVPHGIGVYLGYEEFYDNGYKSRTVAEPPPNDNCRRHFQLEAGHTWCWGDHLYAAMPKDIKEIDDAGA